MKAVQDSKSSGAALAIGGGNIIDSAIRSQIMGVNNTLTGNSYYSEYSSQYHMIDGYHNTASNVTHAYVMGANNIILGDNHTLANDVVSLALLMNH